MKLFPIRRLAHDPQGVLTVVQRLALVGIELPRNISLRIRKVGLELGIASLAHAENWGRIFLYDTQASVRHDASLAHREERA